MAIVYKKYKPKELDYIEYESNIQTPKWLIKVMISYIPKQIKTIFDPTAGSGNIVQEIIKHSKNNKYDWEVSYSYNFFELLKTDNRYDCIIMNPPFSKKNLYLKEPNKKIDDMKSSHVGYYILKKCMEMTSNVICIIPWYYIINSVGRTNELIEYGFKKLINIPRKAFKSIRVQTCLIILERGYRGKTEFENLII